MLQVKGQRFETVEEITRTKYSLYVKKESVQRLSSETQFSDSVQGLGSVTRFSDSVQ